MFLHWARDHRLVRPIDIPRHHRGNGLVLADSQRIDAIRRILTGNELMLPTRVAAGLVLLFGQPVHRVAALTIDQVTVTERAVEIKFGRHNVTVPEPFATLVRELHRSPANTMTAAHREKRWLFPGYAAGQHINADHLSHQLRQHGAPPLAARAAAWQEFVRSMPSSLVADAFGISPVTAMKHAQFAGADYLRRYGSRAIKGPGEDPK